MASMSRTLGPAAWARGVPTATRDPTRGRRPPYSGEAWVRAVRDTRRDATHERPRRPAPACPLILGHGFFMHWRMATPTWTPSMSTVRGSARTGTPGQRDSAMRCANDHDNADAELFCCECGAVMPPLRSATQIRIRWFAEPSHLLAPRHHHHRGQSRGRAQPHPATRAQGDDALVPCCTRAQLRRRPLTGRGDCRRPAHRRRGHRAWRRWRARRRRSGAATPRAAGSHVHQRIDARLSAARTSPISS